MAGSAGSFVPPTIIDIALAAGVSTSSVSYALNGKPGVSKKTRAQILEIAERLGYAPNPSARALASAKARAFGLVINRPAEVVGADRFFPAFMAGAQSVLSAAGYALLLDILVDGNEAEHYARLVNSGQVAGFFLTDLLNEDPRLDLLAQRGVPAVIAGFPPVADYPFPGVTLDEEAAIRQAVEELLELGHTRIASVSGPATMIHAMRRRSIVIDALAQGGFKLVADLHGDFGAPSGAEAMTRLLALKKRPTAVLFGNDQMAIAGAAAATGMGFTLPDDISVIGVDDIDLAGLVHPPLTTISSQFFNVGVTSAQVLLDAPQDGNVHLIGQASLVHRGSVAPPPH